jgi:hypothetical protein
LRVIKSLTPLQLAVLQVMSEKGSDYAPFTNDTLGLYASKIGRLSTEVDITSAQGALSALQEKGFVWRASRGVYAVEDKTTNELLKKL